MPETTDILWTPSTEFFNNSGLKKYERWLNDQFGLQFKSYGELWKWSNDHFEDFWESLWKYFDIKAHSGYSSVIDRYDMPGARWFNGATLNYAEHIFQMKSDDRPALIFANESGDRVNVSWKELENQVSSVQSFL